MRDELSMYSKVIKAGQARVEEFIENHQRARLKHVQYLKIAG